MTHPSTPDAPSLSQSYIAAADEAIRLTEDATRLADFPAAHLSSLRAAAASHARAALSATQAGLFSAARGHNAESGRLSREAEALKAKQASRPGRRR